MIRSLFQILMILVVVFLTTYGWRPSRKYVVDLSAEEKETAKNLKETVELIVKDFGVRNYVHYSDLERTARYIQQQFKNLGYKTTFMPYELEGRIFKNVIAELPSVSPNAETVIIGAHYDSCFNPGADDNASGVASVLELARLLKGEKFKYNIKFISFVNEEPPFYGTERMGSRQIARQSRKKGEKIKAAIILDLVAYYKEEIFSQKYLPFMGPFYPNRGNFIAIIGDLASRGIVSELKSGFRKDSDFPVESLAVPGFLPGTNFSDHWSFWQEGYKAVLVTDTAFLRNPYYHSKSDLPDTLDYDRTAAMLHGLKKAIILFSN